MFLSNYPGFRRRSRIRSRWLWPFFLGAGDGARIGEWDSFLIQTHWIIYSFELIKCMNVFKLFEQMLFLNYHNIFQMIIILHSINMCTYVCNIFFHRSYLIIFMSIYSKLPVKKIYFCNDIVCYNIVLGAWI